MKPAATLRAATADDAERLVLMGLRFHSSTPYATLIPANPIAMRATVDRMLADPDRNAVLVAERDADLIGMFGVCLYDHPLSGECCATELFWWMNPESRGGAAALRLLSAAEAWAKTHGARMLQMIAPDERVAQWYARLGFTRVEVSYQKGLSA